MLNQHIDLSGKTAVVTGASRGIGKAAVQRFAAAGANVVLLARSTGDISKIAKDIGDSALAVACDVSQWDDVDSAFKQAKREIRFRRHTRKQCRHHRSRFTH